MSAESHTAVSPRRRGNFFVVMAAGIVAIVVYGFSQTFVMNLLRPNYPRPAILYIHLAVFTAWLLLFCTQVSLARAGRVAWHRRLGKFGVILGAIVPVIGVATAIVMTRLRVAHGEMGIAVGFPVPCWDMIGFTSAFVLAVHWRQRPEFHRRLMFMATATLTAAAWGRMPFLDSGQWFYSGVDFLIAVAALRDLIIDRRIHPVYLIGLPALIAGQFLVSALCGSPWWLATAPDLFR